MLINTKINKCLAGLLTFILIVSSASAFIKSAEAAAGDYGKITEKDVALRDSASTSAGYNFRMPKYWIVEILSSSGSGANLWYRVKARNPEYLTDPARDYVKEGYVLGSCLAPLSETGYNAWVAAGKPDQGDFAVETAVPAASPAPADTSLPADTTVPTDAAAPAGTPPPGGTSSGSGASAFIGTVAVTNAGGVNMRKTADGDLLIRIDARGTSVTILDAAVKNGKTWYKVQYGSLTGFILGDYLNLTGTPAPTSASSGGSSSASAITKGYVKLVLSSANLRQTPNGARLNEWLPQNGRVMPYISEPTVHGTYTWYEIRFIDGKHYFVRGDTVALCDANGNPLSSGGAAEGGALTPTAAPPAGSGIIRLTKSDVNLRKTEGGAILDRLAKGVELLYTAATYQGGYYWYYVTTASGVKGYIRDDCCTVVSGDTSGGSGSGGATVGEYGSFRLTMDEVMLRNKPAGTYLEKLKIGTILPVVAQPAVSGAYTWYPVRTAGGKNGYVRGDTGVYTGSYGTPPPTAGVSGAYVLITSAAVNLRKTAGGAVIGRVDKGDVCKLTGAVSKSGGFDWYPILAGGLAGFVRGDMCRVLSAEEADAYLNHQPIPSPTPVPTGSASTRYLITIVDSVNLRASASKDAQAVANVKLGTVIAFTDSQTVGGSLWYKIVYENQVLWVLGSTVKVMTQAEYDAWLAANPAATPPPSNVITGYVKTTAGGLNIRKTPGGAVTGNRIETKGTVLPYQGNPVASGKILYFYCQTVYGYGYISGDYLEICDSAGKPLATPAPTSSSQAGKEASYATLKLGATGDPVKNMVTELKAQGYFAGAITSTYTSAVQSAVMAFQRAKGLSADGIAGPNTLHALFGTVPVGTGNQPEFVMYACEKIDWFTGGIQTIWAKGKNAVLKDVKTGLTMNVHRWSGGNHADVEPLTASDTARLCKMYGVSSSEQITSSTHWQRRPIWVTVGGRTFAASMYGVPHNYPEGNTITTNNFKGQFCIHFVNSRTHTSNKVDPDHQAAINEAYNAAPVKK